MKATEYAWDFGHGPGYWFSWPGEKDGENWIFASIRRGERLWVRMDNGQLCKFRRKEPK